MGEKTGGDMIYLGMALELSHRRMDITAELLEQQKLLLREVLHEAHAPESLIRRWLKINTAFWEQIKNNSMVSFEAVDLKYEPPGIFPNPAPSLPWT